MSLWFACAEPERPTDAFVMWHYRGCRACSIKVDVLSAMYPADTHVAWLSAAVEVPDHAMETE